MTIEEVKKRMDNDEPVVYRGEKYEVTGINKLNQTATLKSSPVDIDVKASELNDN